MSSPTGNKGRGRQGKKSNLKAEEGGGKKSEHKADDG
jgi:hypothetical protein